MGEVYVDFLDSYRKFFEKFTLSVDPSDQLPVKVAGYNLIEPEIAGAVADWALQYLEQRKCPPFLVAYLVRKVVEEVRHLSKIDPLSCGYRSEVGDFLSLKLMQTCISKLVEVCARYQDNAELSTLPSPLPLPPVTTCAIKNSRRSMEDRHVVIHDFHTLFNIKGYGPASYYGVFDGHNGVDAAIYSVSHLHQYLAESPHYPARPVLALKDACVKTDDLFSMKAQRENLHGGTTAVFALLRPKEHKLYVAWLGDSQAVLVRRGVPLQIVKPHKPDRTDERDRIEGMGGTVLYWGAWRVNGQLAVSRAIGDVEYKPYVTAMPDVEEITLDGTEDFLILACDGLWDFVTEQQASNAVYKQLQDNPDDLEAVGYRLVALSKEQSSQDNISVVVVFLAEPSEVAKRLMETASPNPFVSRNGADLFCGGAANGQHRTPSNAFDEDEDFGPETDVDMVDDVLLSPAIAAAKALVQGAKEADNDLELQRQQLADFDDPADISRDTPTPPAHEVASNANADNLAESGGEESEEEWNYIPGKDTKPESDTQEQDDMSSQLNPNAAEFVPVSPTRLLMQDDAIISASPRLGFEINMDNIHVPSEKEFSAEIAQRPGDLELINGPKHSDNYFMRDNFSTLRNKGKENNAPSTCAESLNSSTLCNLEDIPFDQLKAVQNIEEKVTSGVLGKASAFGSNENFSNNAFGVTNIFDKNDPMTASVMELKDLIPSLDNEESVIPGTPKSTIVEAPISPTNDDVSPMNHQTELDSPVDDYAINERKSPELISPGDGPQEGLTSGQERTSSSGFESESGAEEGDTNIPDGFITEHRKTPPIDLSFKPIDTFSDTNPFGALQTPSSTTPLDQFNVNMETDLEQSGLETPKKDMVLDKHISDNTELLLNTPSSFISLRHSPTKETTVPFDELESPKDIPQFEHPPNANSILLAAELPKSPQSQKSFEEILTSIKQESVEEDIDKQEPLAFGTDNHFASIKQELEVDFDNQLSEIKTEKVGIDDETHVNPLAELEESNCIVEKTDHNKEITPLTSHEDLDTTAEFLIEESKLLHDEQESEKISNIEEEHKSEIPNLTIETHEPTLAVLVAAEKDLFSSGISPIPNVEKLFDKNEIEHDDESKLEIGDIKDFDTESETKEMKLEFESHIDHSKTSPVKSFEDDLELKSSPDDIKSLEDGFEVISKEELTLDGTCQSEKEEHTSLVGVNSDQLSPTNQTNPFMVKDNMHINESVTEPEKHEEEIMDSSVSHNLLNAIDDFSSAIEETILSSQQSALLSSHNEITSPVEPQATKSVSYQTLTPADEPKLTRTETYVTGIKEEAPKSPSPEIILSEEVKVEESVHLEQALEDAPIPTDTKVLIVDEPVLTKSEPVQSQVVTETLITALEETSEVPSVATTEVPSTAGTPPPTPAPGLESKDDSSKTDILVAAVAAAGAVAAGSAIVAESEMKKAAAPIKKPLAGVAKKSDTVSKAPGKTAAGKAPAAKQVTVSKTTTTTTKPAGPTGKPTSTTLASKAPTTKLNSAPTTTKKPTSAPITKPSATKPAAPSATKPAGGALTVKQPVPKQLPVTKTSAPTLKSSKPTTPTSKPTTPTTPKSPGLTKADAVKSPPRPAARSTLTTSRTVVSTKPTGPTTDKPGEKKPLTNGDVKSLIKKTDVATKKLSTTNAKPPATKPTTTNVPPSKPAVSGAKTTSASTKTPPTTMKTASTVAAKTKPPTTTNTKPAVALAKRPMPVTKTADKTVKDSANKQISSTKSVVNGKLTQTKTIPGAKKTDTKVNGKISTEKQPPIKKPDALKKEEEKSTQIQEDNVTTTNGFPEHIIEQHESMKIEELTPVIVDGVN